jgi:hypothetical protein
MINAKINISKYFVIDDDSELVAFVTFWILNPIMKEEVPIKKETTVRTFPVIAIAIGVPNLVGCAVWLCCCALTVLSSMARNSSIITNDTMSDDGQSECVSVLNIFNTFQS